MNFMKSVVSKKFCRNITLSELNFEIGQLIVLINKGETTPQYKMEPSKFINEEVPKIIRK